MINFRFTSSEDYPQLVEWWRWFRFPPPSIDALPNNMKDGIMVVQGSTNICAGFLYGSASSLCWCEFIVSNPDVKDKELRKLALITLIDELSHWAKAMGFKAIFTSLNNENLIKHYEKCGYVKGSKAFEMIKAL